jgi:hypothetical protein
MKKRMTGDSEGKMDKMGMMDEMEPKKKKKKKKKKSSSSDYSVRQIVGKSSGY